MPTGNCDCLCTRLNEWKNKSGTSVPLFSPSTAILVAFSGNKYGGYFFSKSENCGSRSHTNGSRNQWGAYIPACWVYLLKAASNKQKRMLCSSWHRPRLTKPPVQTNINARSPPAGEQVLHNAKNQPPFVAISGNKRRRSRSKGAPKCPLIYFFLIRRVQRQSRLSLGKSFPLPDRRQVPVRSKAGPCEIPEARPWVPTKPLAAPRG